MDIRLQLANEIAERIGAVFYPGRCACGWPLLEYKDQRLPFCWGCTTDRVTAERGRNLLERIKQEITITHIGNDAYVHYKKVA